MSDHEEECWEVELPIGEFCLENRREVFEASCDQHQELDHIQSLKGGSCSKLYPEDRSIAQLVVNTKAISEYLRVIAECMVRAAK